MKGAGAPQGVVKLFDENIQEALREDEEKKLGQKEDSEKTMKEAK